MTPAEYSTLRDLSAAGTPGPWEANVLGSEGYAVMSERRRHAHRIHAAHCGYEDWDTDKANAALIAAMRNSFDELLAIAEDMEKIRALVDPICPCDEGDSPVASVAELVQDTAIMCCVERSCRCFDGRAVIEHAQGAADVLKAERDAIAEERALLIKDYDRLNTQVDAIAEERDQWKAWAQEVAGERTGVHEEVLAERDRLQLMVAGRDESITELDRKWRKYYADLTTTTEDRDRLRAAIEPVAHCGVIHSGEPRGFTCLDRVAQAKDAEQRFSDDYRARILALEHLCAGCRVRAALDERPPT